MRIVIREDVSAPIYLCALTWDELIVIEAGLTYLQYGVAKNGRRTCTNEIRAELQDNIEKVLTEHIAEPAEVMEADDG